MLMAAKPQQTLECTIHVYIIHARIIWLHLLGTLRWALAQASRSWWELHSANARGQAAAREEEQYKCCTQIKA